MVEEAWKNVSIPKKLWYRIGDYHRRGSRPKLLEEAWNHYEQTVLKEEARNHE